MSDRKQIGDKHQAEIFNGGLKLTSVTRIELPPEEMQILKQQIELIKKEPHKSREFHSRGWSMVYDRLSGGTGGLTLYQRLEIIHLNNKEVEELMNLLRNK